ncbi:hypothetical protein JD844_005067 [Phrynosoma platyrhinos]|uniref:Uncharacterized protein n=1 Tax=Phrynosoma platyrhinos TaxID=52577 RepID=A0ABQ7SE49_PHRPL|nr:hypothetical protein JD844_005067 [Phrynosoma platyrhinos]
MCALILPLCTWERKNPAGSSVVLTVAHYVSVSLFPFLLPLVYWKSGRAKTQQPRGDCGGHEKDPVSSAWFERLVEKEAREADKMFPCASGLKMPPPSPFSKHPLLQKACSVGKASLWSLFQNRSRLEMKALWG